MMRFMDPFEEIDRIAGSFGGRWRGGIMPMDAFEHDGIYTLRFDLPGVNPDHVDLTVEGNVLTVTAERAVEETGDVTWLLRERPAGTHRREVRLGDHLDAARVNARRPPATLLEARARERTPRHRPKAVKPLVVNPCTAMRRSSDFRVGEKASVPCSDWKEPPLTST